MRKQPNPSLHLSDGAETPTASVEQLRHYNTARALLRTTGAQLVAWLPDIDAAGAGAQHPLSAELLATPGWLAAQTAALRGQLTTLNQAVAALEQLAADL